MSDTPNIISDAEIAVLNAARAILERIANEHGFTSKSGLVRAATHAEVAENALFKFLNVTNAFTGREMTYEQLHNRPRPPIEDVPEPASLRVPEAS
jgi:hypothetical protein